MTDTSEPPRITSVTVARVCNVSQATVSRALRGDPRISEATRKRIVEVANALGYVASDLGRNLSTRRTRQVAMVTDLENPLYPELLPAIHDELARSGYRTVVVAERGDEAALHEPLLNRSVDGAVLTTTRIGSSLAHELNRRRFPFVFLNRYSDGIDADSVTADNVGGAASMAELLLGLGHRRIGALLGPAETSTGRDREAGFRQTLAEAGVALPEASVYRGWFSFKHGVDGYEKVLGGPTPPTAIFCVSDAVAVGALNAARRAGLSVPDDLAVVGFDDLPIASWPVFELTTVHVPLQDMARAAVQLLVKRLDAPERGPGVHEVQETSLVLRSTHGRAPA